MPPTVIGNGNTRSIFKELAFLGVTGWQTNKDSNVYKFWCDKCRGENKQDILEFFEALIQIYNAP